MDATYFETRDALRDWLAVNHDRVDELWIGFFKKGTGKPSVTYLEAVEEALCFGWIDGVRHSIDAESYANRFTPRKKGSNWSAINIRRVQELMEAGRMAPPGIAAFEARDPGKTYSYGREAASLGDEYEALLRGSENAWAFFREQTPWYRRMASFWVVSAKQEETRRRRLGQLIEDSEEGLWIKPLRSAQRGTRN